MVVAGVPGAEQEVAGPPEGVGKGVRPGQAEEAGTLSKRGPPTQEEEADKLAGPAEGP